MERQRGVAAVELALILVVSSFLIFPVVFLFARVFYHYNVLKQATQDAANFMASVPRIELSTNSGLLATQARATAMVMAAISEAGITPPEDLLIRVSCNNGGVCKTSAPVEDVQVIAIFKLVDGFSQDSWRWLPHDSGYSWEFEAISNARYQN